jgi:hypothetical protein
MILVNYSLTVPGSDRGSKTNWGMVRLGLDKLNLIKVRSLASFDLETTATWKKSNYPESTIGSFLFLISN